MSSIWQRTAKRWKEKIEKAGKITACPPIFHSPAAHPSSVHLLIWSCCRLDNRDLQLLETNDAVEEGQQLTASGGTLVLRWWDGVKGVVTTISQSLMSFKVKFTSTLQLSLLVLLQIKLHLGLIHWNEKLTGDCGWKKQIEKLKKILKSFSIFPKIHSLAADKLIKTNIIVKHQWSVNPDGSHDVKRL